MKTRLPAKPRLLTARNPVRTQCVAGWHENGIRGRFLERSGLSAERRRFSLALVVLLARRIFHNELVASGRSSWPGLTESGPEDAPTNSGQKNPSQTQLGCGFDPLAEVRAGKISGATWHSLCP